MSYTESGQHLDSRSVKELKSRLHELGLEIPSTILEKTELVDLVHEAEKEVRRTEAWAAAPSFVAGKPEKTASAVLPSPWFQRESRSHPGKFYYVNAETGQTTWERPTLPSVAREEAPATVPEMRPPSSAANGIWERKHDYRDDAFSAAVDELEDSIAPRVGCQDRPWSRAGDMSCRHGRAGVLSLSLSQVSARHSTSSDSVPDVATVSDASVHGKTYTWVRGEVIGRGALGRVFKALEQGSGEMLAVKEVLINKDDDEESEFMEALKNEIDILAGLKHVHIVSYLGHDYIDGCLFMYMEFMAGGSVTQALQQFGAFEESLMADYSKQVLDGLEYLHTRSLPVVHRDIKGSNILLGLDCRAKLADFGCSKKAQHTLTHTMRGSVPWMAPEVIAHYRYGRASDIWSFGCFVIEMGTARVPWGRFDNQMAAMVKIGMSKALPKFPDGISEVCEDFIKRCLQRDASLRPSSADLLNHELVRDILPIA